MLSKSDAEYVTLLQSWAKQIKSPSQINGERLRLLAIIEKLDISNDKYRRAIELASDVIGRVAGPESCGCEVGSMKHMMQITRQSIKEILGDANGEG
jgi:hypothetical protein